MKKSAATNNSLKRNNVESENIPMEKQELAKAIGALMAAAVATPTEPQPNAFEELGKELGHSMGEALKMDIYDPMPSRGVRGFLQMKQAHGTQEERDKADKTFKDNCDLYEKHFGLAALVERLKRTYIGAYAESINRPVQDVSFSEALNWRSNQPQVSQ